MPVTVTLAPLMVVLLRPPPASATVPPLMVELTPSMLPLLVLMVPLVLVTIVPLKPSVPPLVASNVPVLVVPPLASIVSPTGWFALMVPELTNVIWLSPMLPAPEMVS